MNASDRVKKIVEEEEWTARNIKLYHVPVQDKQQGTAVLARIPTEKDLHRIASSVGFNWEMLAPYLLGNLGNAMAKVEQIKEDGHNDIVACTYRLLLTWRRQAAPDTRLGHLFYLMLQVGTSVNIQWPAIAEYLDIEERDIRACKHGYKPPEEDKDSEQSDLDLDVLTQKQYEIAIKEGKEEDKTIKLMIIGCYGQGKTTLARRLLAQDVDGIDSTNGIDIHNVACTQNGAVWESRQDENLQYESLKRLAMINVSENLSSLGSDNEKVSEINPSADIETLGTMSNDSLPLSQNESESNHLPSKTSIDIKLFQKLKQELHLTKDEKTQKVSLWDFGGQFVFYATHQLFHSRDAVYLLVFDLHKGLDSPVIDEDYPGGTHPLVKSMKDYIEFWITSVHSYVGNKDATHPQVILVGTHKDQIKDEKEADEYFESIREMFDGRKLGNHIYPECFAVAGKDPTDDQVDRLRETIIKIGRQNKQVIPACWIPLELELKQRNNENIITFQEVIEIDKVMDQPIGSANQVKSFLKFHHARGTFIYFDEGELTEYVVVNPIFIVDAFKCIITSGRFCKCDRNLRPLWKKLTVHAILEPDLLKAVWGHDAENRFVKWRDVLIAILKRHKIIAEALKLDEKSENVSTLGYFIVPSFLRKSRHNEIEAFLEGRNCTSVSLVFEFDNEAVVQTVFQRITGAAVGTWSVVDFQECNLLFENAGVYRLNLSYAGMIVFVKNTIELLVVHMCPGEKISFEVPDFFRRFVENVIKNEFRKLNSADVSELQSFKIAVRCQHSLHKCKGSKATHDLEMLKSQSVKKVCCPDNLAHESLHIDRILQEWFLYKITNKVVPRRRLSQQEFVLLSSAIGSEWKLFGLLLEVDEVAIQHIEMDIQRTAMRIYEMLQTWNQEKKDEATLDVLVDAIDKLPPNTVKLDVVKNLIDNI
ncbi:uncharacterized protein LOC123551704 isoform X2 [Mercenaria mercenaria]|uniref:uncharacterized protein LOC123551704 isoform X2 n=1 Tax=Mercenaria mercenaria TaxID=6596 RepID=UPI00234F475B|nr:uncharacterized protein LOC123551704 isoform X2 [Mercenaria mercenaria]